MCCLSLRHGDLKMMDWVEGILLCSILFQQSLKIYANIVKCAQKPRSLETCCKCKMIFPAAIQLHSIEAAAHSIASQKKHN